MNGTAWHQGRWSRASVLALWFFLVAVILAIPPGRALEWDALGYYLYLPAFLIHHDPFLLHQDWLQQAFDTYGRFDGGTFYQAHQVANGNWVMKYPMGLAVLWAPFVAVAHVAAPLLGYAADGFSRPYQWAVVAAEMVYALIGLFWLRAVLLRWWKDGVAALTLVLVVLGTTYLHQALFANAMPHIFLFTLHAGTLYATMRWHDTQQSRFAVLLAAVIGLAALSRPTEIILLLIPVLWRGPYTAQRWRMLLLVTAGIGLVGSAQLIYWKYATGQFLYMSYVGREEGFDFLQPHVLDVLFSFRKGWFIYAPVLLFAVFGLFTLHRDAPETGLAVPVFIAANIYLVSTWSTWWYAESFGSRALMQSIAVMALPLAATVAAIGRAGRVARVSWHVLLGGLVLLNIFQSWQAITGLIPGSRMTFSYYVAIFGRTAPPVDGEQRLLVDRSAPLPETLQEDSRHHLVKRLWITGDRVVDGRIGPVDGRAKYTYSTRDLYSPPVRFAFKDLTRQGHLWVRVRATAACSPNAEGDLVLTMEHGGILYGYHRIGIRDGLREWGGVSEVSTIYLTPEVRQRTDSLAVYYWHHNGTVELGPIEVECYEPVIPPPF